MKFIVAIVLVCALAVSALPADEARDIATVLGTNTVAPRFVETRVSAPSGGVVAFRDDSTSSTSSSVSGEESSEFDAQIAQADEDIRKAKEAIKESEDCARRATEQKAALRTLQDQRDHLEREKQKQVLQAKLDRQMKDLSEINRMSRALKSKFSELKRTQQLIRSKMSGTKTSLNQLDGESDLSTSDISENSKDIVGELNSMHQAQNAILDSSHKSNSREVKNNMDQANKLAAKGKGDNKDLDDV